MLPDSFPELDSPQQTAASASPELDSDASPKSYYWQWVFQHQSMTESKILEIDKELDKDDHVTRGNSDESGTVVGIRTDVIQTEISKESNSTVTLQQPSVDSNHDDYSTGYMNLSNFDTNYNVNNSNYNSSFPDSIGIGIRSRTPTSGRNSSCMLDNITTDRSESVVDHHETNSLSNRSQHQLRDHDIIDGDNNNQDLALGNSNTSSSSSNQSLNSTEKSQNSEDHEQGLDLDQKREPGLMSHDKDVLKVLGFVQDSSNGDKKGETLQDTSKDQHHLNQQNINVEDSIESNTTKYETAANSLNSNMILNLNDSNSDSLSDFALLQTLPTTDADGRTINIECSTSYYTDAIDHCVSELRATNAMAATTMTSKYDSSEEKANESDKNLEQNKKISQWDPNLSFIEGSRKLMRIQEQNLSLSQQKTNKTLSLQNLLLTSITSVDEKDLERYGNGVAVTGGLASVMFSAAMKLVFYGGLLSVDPSVLM